jgi:uncharacterized Rmd1/YagE family protein
MINVDNLKRTNNGIRCDRYSDLGNPFFMRYEEERDAVCDAFREYFYQSLSLKNEIVDLQSIAKRYGVVVSYNWTPRKTEQIHKAIERLENHLKLKPDLTLLCWCKPKRCHVDTIAEYLSSS